MKKRINFRGQVTFEFLVTIIIVLVIFVVGMAIFQSRNDLNNNNFQKWDCEDISYRLARNINNAYFLDENSSIRDSLFWSGNSKGFSISNNSVNVYSGDVFFSASIVTSDVDFVAADLNGVIFFKKINGRVVVDYSG